MWTSLEAPQTKSGLEGMTASPLRICAILPQLSIAHTYFRSHYVVFEGPACFTLSKVGMV